MLRYFNAYILYPFLEKKLNRDIKGKIKILHKDFSQNFDARQERRLVQLHQILELAKHHVPYYRDLFQKIQFNPDSILKDIGYLQDIPFLTKDIMREQGERLLNENISKAGLHLRKTGGSTGQSVAISYSQEALDWTAAVNLFVLEMAQRSHAMKEVHLSTNFHQDLIFKERLREWLKCQAMNRTNVLTDSFDDQAMKKLWKRLKFVRPYIVQGHPSTLYALALYVKYHCPKARPAFKAFESTGEYLDPKKRETIEKYLKCKIYNRYGNAEFGVIAHSEEDPFRLKVLDYIVYPESVPLIENAHELVCTGLTNDVMPLIRYRTGDLGKVVRDEKGEYVESLYGRIHDVITLDGKTYPTHYLQDVLDRVGGVDEFQVHKVQDKMILKIVPTPEANHHLISNRVQSLWGEQLMVEFTDFEGFTRQGWRDKFRYLVVHEDQHSQGLS